MALVTGDVIFGCAGISIGGVLKVWSGGTARLSSSCGLDQFSTSTARWKQSNKLLLLSTPFSSVNGEPMTVMIAV